MVRITCLFLFLLIPADAVHYLFIVSPVPLGKSSEVPRGTSFMQDRRRVRPRLSAVHPGWTVPDTVPIVILTDDETGFIEYIDHWMRRECAWLREQSPGSCRVMYTSPLSRNYSLPLMELIACRNVPDAMTCIHRADCRYMGKSRGCHERI